MERGCTVHKLVADIALFSGRKVLCVKYRDVARYDGQRGWFLPDDFLAHTEHPEAAATRIAREQLGVRPEDVRMTDTDSFGNRARHPIPHSRANVPPSADAYRREVAHEVRRCDGDQREEQYRANEQRPRHERDGRIAAEVPLPEDGVQGGEHRGWDHRERTFGGFETKLTFRPGEKDHDAEAREREGDSGGLKPSEAFVKKGRREHRDEGGRRGNDESGRPRGDGRIGFSQ